MHNRLVSASMICAAAVSLTLSAGLAAAQSPSLRAIARTGDQVPGLPAGSTLAEIIAPVASASGDVFFIGRFAVPGGSDDIEAIVKINAKGAAAALIVLGGQAPALPTGVILDSVRSDWLVSDRNGGLAFVGSTTQGEVAYRSASGIAFSVAAIAGQPLPGLPPGTFLSATWPIGAVNLDDSGRITLDARLAGTGVTSANDSAILAIDPDATTTVLFRGGDQAPGLAPGVAFQESSDLGRPFFAPNDQVTLQSRVAGPGITALNNEVCFSTQGGPVLVKIAQENDPAPGLSSSATFTSFLRPSINSSGQSAFVAGLEGSAFTTDNNSALYRHDPVVGLELLVQKGAVLPGLPAGFRLTGFPNDPALQPSRINRHGDVAFFATAGSTPGSAAALALIAPGVEGPRAVAVPGQPAPGPSTLFALLDGRSLDLNDLGQAAFSTSGPSSHAGCYISDPIDGVQLIAAAGQTVDVNPDPLIDDIRTISAWTPLRNVDGLGVWMFTLSFDDGSSVIAIATVPTGLSCLALDLTADNQTDSADVAAYVAAFIAADPAADLTGDDQIDSGDLQRFISHFLACAG